MMGSQPNSRKLIGPIMEENYYGAGPDVTDEDPLCPAHPQLATPLRAMVMTHGHMNITRIRLDTLTKASYTWTRDHAKRM